MWGFIINKKKLIFITLFLVINILLIPKLIDKKSENIFKSIDNDKNIVFEKDNKKYIKYIDDIKKYLITEDMQSLTNNELEEMSKNIKCFSINSGRIITYEPDPINHGLLNHGVFAIYQKITKQKEIEVYTLFFGEAKHIEYVLETNDGTLIVAGKFMEVNPYYTFVDAFQLANNQILKKKIVSNFVNEDWIIKDNSIIYTQAQNIENSLQQYNKASYIEEISFNKIIVSDGENKLILEYNDNIDKYEVNISYSS